MSKRSKKKVVKYRGFSFFNIGTVLFGIIFVYMIICLGMYLTTVHITSYVVTAGSLSENYRYSALALREETVVTAKQAGTVTYYAREGNKTGVGNVICSINESGNTALTLEEVSEDGENTNSLDDESLSKLKELMSSFSGNYNNNNFQNVYNFKGDLEGAIMESTSASDLVNVDGSTVVNACTASEAGIVVYSEDGYESKTTETVLPEDFDQVNYEKTNFRQNPVVKSGDPIFKLVTSETWYLMMPLTDEVLTELADQTSVRFRFLEDGTSYYAGFSTTTIGNQTYGILELDYAMSRFATERFVDIELVLNRRTGLKIPNSAIAEKTFYTIPDEFAVYDREADGTPSEIRLLVESTDGEGTAEQKYITATVYEKVEDDFLVDCALFEEGDTILKQDSTRTYTISEISTLQGVYNINKGYAVFREINIIDQNEEYCIVEEGSTFGLAQYDHIVLDASTVQDDDIVIRR